VPKKPKPRGKKAAKAAKSGLKMPAKVGGKPISIDRATLWQILAGLNEEPDRVESAMDMAVDQGAASDTERRAEQYCKTFCHYRLEHNDARRHDKSLNILPQECNQCPLALVTLTEREQKAVGLENDFSDESEEAQNEEQRGGVQELDDDLNLPPSQKRVKQDDIQDLGDLS